MESNIFDLSNDKLNQISAINTVNEILSQPTRLAETLEKYLEEKEKIDEFLTRQKSTIEKTRVIFTGAGTSEFVGNVLTDYLNSENEEFEYVSIGTTSLVSNPSMYFKKNKPTLLVSFARSGNSPESLEAIKLLEKIVDNPYQLAITCASDGALSNALCKKSNSYVFITPDGTNDKGFAMTSSFTSMLLSALLIFSKDSASSKIFQVNKAIDLVSEVFDRKNEFVSKIMKADFDRIVYLGSGVFSHLVKEAQLKILELTAGEVVTCYESSMGFRHGPKSFVNPKTVIVGFVSNDEHTALYDADVLNEVYHDGISNLTIALSNRKQIADYDVFELKRNRNLKDIYLTFSYIAIAQIISAVTSVKVGNTPDSPSKTGTVNRVVKGVVIHDYMP